MLGSVGTGWNILEKRRCVERKKQTFPPHPSQTWTMFPLIYGRPLWPYGRLGIALDRATSPPPLERYVRQRGDGWNILEKRRCVEGKNHMPTHKPDLDDVSFNLRTPPMAIWPVGARTRPIDDPSALRTIR